MQSTARQRLARQAVLVLAAALAFTACGAVDEDDPETDRADPGETQLDLATWKSRYGVAPVEEAVESSIQGVDLDVTVSSLSDYLVQLRAGAASGTFPDIVALEPGAMLQDHRDLLMPMQDCAQLLWGDEWQDEFHAIAMEQARLGNPTGDENFYGLPATVLTVNLWATIPLFEDAPVDPPETWDELLAVADHFGEEGAVAPLLLGAQDNWQRRDIFLWLINDIAPGLIYEAEVGEAEFTDPAFIDAMEHWKVIVDDVAQEGSIGLAAFPGASDLIRGGHAALFQFGPFWLGFAAGEDLPPLLAEGLQGYRPIAMPSVVGTEGPSENVVGGIDYLLAVNKETTNPEAACEVVGSLISGDGFQSLVNEFEAMPAFKSMEPEEFVSEHHAEAWEFFSDELLPKAKYSRQLRDPEVSEALDNALAAVGTGQMAPQDAMESVQAAWTPPE